MQQTIDLVGDTCMEISVVGHFNLVAGSSSDERGEGVSGGQNAANDLSGC